MNTTELFDTQNGENKTDIILRLLETDEVFKIKFNMLRSELLSKFNGYIKSIPKEVDERLLTPMELEPESPRKTVRKAPAEPILQKQSSPNALSQETKPKKRKMVSFEGADLSIDPLEIYKRMNKRTLKKEGINNNLDIAKNESPNKLVGEISDKLMNSILEKTNTSLIKGEDIDGDKKVKKNFATEIEESVEKLKSKNEGQKSEKEKNIGVSITSISPEVMEKLKELYTKKEGIFEESKEKSYDGMKIDDVNPNSIVSEDKKGFINGFIGKFLRSKFGKASFAAFLPMLSKVGIVGAVIGSTLLLAYEGVFGYMHSSQWGTSKGAGTIATMMAGTGDPGLKNALLNAMGKAAVFGTIGWAVGGPIGALAGGIIGLIFGAIAGAIGAEKIAKGVDNAILAVNAARGNDMGDNLSNDDTGKKIKELTTKFAKEYHNNPTAYANLLELLRDNAKTPDEAEQLYDFAVAEFKDKKEIKYFKRENIVDTLTARLAPDQLDHLKRGDNKDVDLNGHIINLAESLDSLTGLLEAIQEGGLMDDPDVTFTRPNSSRLSADWVHQGYVINPKEAKRFRRSMSIYDAMQ